MERSGINYPSRLRDFASKLFPLRKVSHFAPNFKQTSSASARILSRGKKLPDFEPNFSLILQLIHKKNRLVSEAV